MINGATDRQHRIKIKRPVTSEDGYGGLNTSYEVHSERWAQVLPPSFKEQLARGAPVTRETITVEIRPADKAVKRGWQIEWQGETYVLTSADNTYRERTLMVAQLYNPGE